MSLIQNLKIKIQFLSVIQFVREKFTYYHNEQRGMRRVNGIRLMLKLRRIASFQKFSDENKRRSLLCVSSMEYGVSFNFSADVPM